MRTLVLSFFPLATDSLAGVQGLGEVESKDLASLRPRGARAVLAELRAPGRDQVLFALTPTDPDDMRGLADLALAVSRGARKGRLSLPAGQVEAAGGSLAAAAQFSWALAAGLLAAALNALAAAWLLGRAAARNARGGEPSVAYLRASYGLPIVGGSVGHTSGIVNAFVRRGLTLRFFGAATPVGVSERVAQVTVPLPATTAYPHELNFHRYSRRFSRAALVELRRQRPSLLYQRYVLNDLSGLRLSRRLHIPLVLEFNGSEVWAQRHWGRPLLLERVSRSIEQACVRHADLVLVVSEPLRQDVLGMGAAPDRVLVYPNCVDTTAFDPDRFDEADRASWRDSLGVPRDAMLVTFVGTFGRWHGADVLARSITSLPDEVSGRRLQFLFIGRGVTEPEVRQVLAADIARGRVTMAGVRPQDETPRTLAASDILASPHVPNPDGSPFFGSPTKLFEYMAMARPIVASDLDQIGRVLRGWTPLEDSAEPGEPLAILTTPGDAGAFADGLMKAFAMSPAERLAMGMRARAHVCRAFTWERQVDAALERIGAGH
jgi:glycosyltransferase involved in cell wall biosynthesis